VTRWVLITRTPADCSDLQRMLEGSDIRLRPFPVLRLEDVTDDPGWQAAVEAARSPGAWLVLASPRAPERLARQARERGASELFELPVAVVGTGTERAARDAGLRPALVGPGTGAGLADELGTRMADGAPVVFACGHDRRPELPEALEAAGHRVLPLVVYRMRPTPPRELPPLPESLHAVVMTSPRAARLYLEGVGGHPLPCPHIALGPTTRDAASGMGIDCRTPNTPDLESLAEELCRT
jgi:uroporphyrinogen-III synthase